MLKTVKALLKRPRWPRLHFPIQGLNVIKDNVALEEKQFSEFSRGLYYPVSIGEVLSSRYQVVGKLGFGVTSTVWLARDLE